MKSIKKKILKTIQEDNFLYNINISREFDHPNIAKIYDLYQDDHYYFVISE